MTPISIVCQLEPGESPEDAMANAMDLAEAMGCDVVWVQSGQVMVVKWDKGRGGRELSPFPDSTNGGSDC